MTTLKVYGDSRLTFLLPYVTDRNNTQVKIVIKPKGAATIRSTASAVWANFERNPYDNVLFMSGVNDLTVWDGSVAKYVFPFTSTEEAVDYMVATYQEFELNLHKRFPRAQLLFGQITGLDLSRYAYIQDHDPLHQEIVNNTIVIVNRELVKINERNWVPTCWAAKHVHRRRRQGRTRRARYVHYYDMLSDGLHPSENLLRCWADDIVNTAFHIS